MIPIPEFQVKDVCAAAAEAMLSDSAMLTEMLEGLAGARQDSFRTALADRKGKFRIGWGEEIPEDWVVTVALAGTDPQHTIGDHATRAYAEPLAGRLLAAALPPGDETAITFTTGVPGLDQVPARGTLRIAAADAPRVEYATYRIVSGACVLEKRGLLGTKDRTHDAGTEVLFYNLLQRVGWMQRVNMRVDVLALDGEFTAILAWCLQAYLLTKAREFDDAGYTLQDLRASDLAPRPPLFPAHMAVRTISMSFLTTLSLPQPLATLVGTNVTVTADEAAAA